MAIRCSACNEFDVVCKRPEACISSFSVTMFDGCRDFVVVPQCFKDRLNDFAENFLVVEDCRGFKYNMHIQVGNEATILCGAYWRLFGRTHKLETGDRVRLSAADHGTCFQAVLLGQGNNDVLDASYLCMPEVSSDARVWLHNTFFNNFADLTDLEVRRVCTALDKLTINVGFEHELMVQKVTDVDMASKVLVIPCKFKNVMRIPFSGHGTINSAKLNERMDSVFTTKTSGDIVIHKGWEEFCNWHSIRSGSVLLLVIENIGQLSVEAKSIKH